MNLDANFKRVPPEAYNRLTHPSPKQFHEFVKWLREKTVSELKAAQGDMAGTKAAFVRFFQRGLRAQLILGELMDMLPSVVIRADYSEPERSQVLAMLKAINLEELGVRLEGSPDMKPQ